MDSFLSGEQCVGEPARVSPALREGLPPQVVGIGYSDLYSYKEATALASRESDMVRVAHLKLGVTSVRCLPSAYLKRRTASDHQNFGESSTVDSKSELV
ncbi:hypothetical protein [Nostoc sp.]|uniref:hypothetical protein n=1 Tax=Nostoc sp. TaxID=1180 RepID=UPI002FF72264